MNPKVAAFTYVVTPTVIASATTVAVHKIIKRFNTSTATHCGVYITENTAGLAAGAVALMMLDRLLYPIARKAFDQVLINH